MKKIASAQEATKVAAGVSHGREPMVSGNTKNESPEGTTGEKTSCRHFMAPNAFWRAAMGSRPWLPHTVPSGLRKWEKAKAKGPAFPIEPKALVLKLRKHNCTNFYRPISLWAIAPVSTNASRSNDNRGYRLTANGLFYPKDLCRRA